jgi:dipeptidyl aminopeptidase/acylaminoacyl peptidase
MRKRLLARSSAAVVILLWLGGAAFAQQNAPQKKPITHDVYDSWKSIQGTKLSADGVWLVYAVTPQDGDGELIVRNLKTNAEIHAARGRDPNFTSDSHFVTFALAPYKKDVDQARKAKKKPEDMPKNGVGVVDLTKSTATVLAEHVKSFRVPDETPQVIVYLTTSPVAPAAAENGSTSPKPKEKKPLGTELVIRDLYSGLQTKITDVSEYGLSKNGAWLAYGVSSKTPASDGAFVLRLTQDNPEQRRGVARATATGARKTLLAGSGNYKGFVFDNDNKQAAFISDRDDFRSAAPRYKLYQWSTDAVAATELPLPSDAMPVSENGRLEFKGDRLLFGTAPVRAPDLDENADLIKVDIWNYRDAELQPMQKVRAEEEKKRNYRAAFNLVDKHFVQLATPDMPDVRTGTSHDRVLGVSNVPYRQLISWDGNYEDYYLVSIADGSRRKILEKERFGATLSPGGKYVLYFSTADNNWYAVSTADGQKTNLTKGLGVKFQSETDDHPDYPQPYGQAGWTTSDASVLLYDRYDIWEVKPDGTGAHMLTAGAGRRQQIVFRNSRTEAAPANQEPEEEVGPRRQTEQPAISTTRPLLLSAVDDRTKASGLYRASFTGNAEPAKVVMLDKAFGTPIKARDADVYTFTLSRFEEFGNLWVSSGAFTDMKKVSDANPQQAQYNWGRSELVEYVNADGKHLKAILTKPENFDPSKKYPMLVYIYEQLTNGLHRYVAPAPGGSSINVTRYVSNGYIILQPDIVYDIGYPGQSALKCVLPAVQTVLNMGFVDPARVGIQGHSWGGYQIAYMITQTNIFRAVEAGAAVDDMFGAYGGIRWGTGMSRAFQYEKTQSRIGVPPWENPMIYMENSPLFWIEKIHTPYLTMANDEDDAVPWQQGIQFFTAMRRLGKEAYMFVYNGEKHGLRQRENQKHWTVHMAEYFDYFFKDAPKPDWMEHGVPYLDKGKRDVSVFYKKTDGK